MVQPVDIMKKLLKVTGPIKTFYIDEWGIKAAYTELRVTTHGRVANAQITPAIDLIGDAVGEARAAALSDGRVECSVIGQFGHGSRWYTDRPVAERQIRETLIRIASRAHFRKEYWQPLYKAVKAFRKYYANKRFSLPDPKAGTELGWRVWHWDDKIKKLKSPTWGTVWHTHELRVPKWNREEVVRGKAGIHAARMPYNWIKASLQETELNGYVSSSGDTIVGIIERWGKYVLGTEGFRCEIAIIKKLKAPNTEIGLALELAYPDCEIVYDD